MGVSGFRHVLSTGTSDHTLPIRDRAMSQAPTALHAAKLIDTTATVTPAHFSGFRVFTEMLASRSWSLRSQPERDPAAR